MKKIIALPLVALLVPAAALAQTSTRFDMICMGRSVTVTDKKSSPETREAYHYIVDLDRNLWCGLGCNEPSVIDKVSDDTITLEDGKGKMLDSSISVNRMSGTFHVLITTHDVPRHPDSSFIVEGECVKAAFSGIPEKRF